MRRQQKVRRPRRPPLRIRQHERPRINISRAEDPFDNRPRVPPQVAAVRQSVLERVHDRLRRVQ